MQTMKIERHSNTVMCVLRLTSALKRQCSTTSCASSVQVLESRVPSSSALQASGSAPLLHSQCMTCASNDLVIISAAFRLHVAQNNNLDTLRT